jgi:hypothetical protein
MYKIAIDEIISCAAVINYSKLFGKYRRLRYQVNFNIKIVKAVSDLSDLNAYFEHLSGHVMSNKDFILACMNKFPNFIKLGVCPYEDIFRYTSCCMVALSQDFTLFKEFPANMKNNIELCKYALSIDVDTIKFMRGDILKCKHTAVAVVSKDHTLFKYFDVSIRSDVAFVKELFRITPSVIQYTNHFTIIDNKKLCKIALKHDGLMLQGLSDSIRNDYTIVKIAVSNNPFAIKFASDELKMNTHLCKIAFAKNKETLRYFHPSIFHAFPTNDVVNAILRLQIGGSTP